MAILVMFLLFFLAPPAVIRLTQDEILQWIAAKKSGPVVDDERGRFSIIAAKVTKAGRPEKHAAVSHSYLVLDGTGEVRVEGQISEEKEASPGEFLGKEITGGRTLPLKKGDLISIPRNTPHQVLPGPQSVSMLIFRTHEKECK